MRVRRIKPDEEYRNEIGPFNNGMDEVTAAHIIPPDRCRNAVNVLFDDKIGAILKRFGKTKVSDFPGANVPRDGFVFTKSDGTQEALISDGISLYTTIDFINYTLLIDGLNDEGFLEFEIADSKVWMLNGIDPVMSYDGNDLIIYDREATGVVEAGSSATQIIDTANRNEADDYWNKRKIVITSGPNAGVLLGTVTDFVQATSILTISGFGGVSPAEGDTYKVGLIIPRGKVVRYLKGRLFVGATPNNFSEIRFSEIADPDTGEFINIDNPRAWPATLQIAVTQHDGDRIWTFSPVLDDRFLVSKRNTIHRIEEDQTFLFTTKLVSNFVGSIFPNTWQEKKGLLTFLGTEQSGYIDLYVSDLVRVKPLHKEGRMKLSFADIRNSIPKAKYINKSTTPEFDAGDVSYSCDTSGGVLKSKSFNFNSIWNNALKTKSNIAIGDNEGEVNIKAQPNWTFKYDCDELPQDANPPWIVTTDPYLDKKILSSKYVVEKNYDSLSDSKKQEFLVNKTIQSNTITQNNVFDTTKDVMLATKISTYYSPQQFPANIGFCKNTLKISTGEYSVNLEFYVPASGAYSKISINGVEISNIDRNLHQWNILIKTDGQYKVWLDGVLFDSGTAESSSDNILSFKHESRVTGQLLTDIGGYAKSEMDFIYFQNIIDTDIPNTLPQSGTLDISLDYTRAPDNFGKLFYDAELNGGTIVMQTASSDDDIIYSSFESLNNGEEPGVDNATVVKRYLKVRFTLTSVGIILGPVISNFLAGFFYRSKALNIGSNISAWRNFLSDNTIPIGTSLITKIRLAKTIDVPLEGDYGPWETIVAGNNIGTILSDLVLPPPAGEGRWVDVKVEGSPNASGDVSELDNFVINWVEGATANLPIRSFIYENRYFLITAQASSQYNNIIFVLDKDNAWCKFIGWNLNAMLAFGGLMIGLSSNSKDIAQYFIADKYDDDNEIINAYVETGEIDFGPSRFSLIELMIENALPTTLKVYYKKQGDTDWISMGELDFSKHNTCKIRASLGTASKQFSFKIQNDNPNEGMDVRVIGYRGIGLPEDFD